MNISQMPERRRNRIYNIECKTLYGSASHSNLQLYFILGNYQEKIYGGFGSGSYEIL